MDEIGRLPRPRIGGVEYPPLRPSERGRPRPHVWGVEWRYLRRGVVVHALRRYGFGLQGVAECGIAPALFDDWRGTGTQNEYELAERLPACRRCLRRVAPSKLQCPPAQPVGGGS